MATETKKSRLDILRWGAGVVLLIAGIVANSHYAQISMPLRLLAWLGLFAVFALLVLQTAKGREFIEFARESRVELYKVVWPSKQETLQTTLIIMVIVLIVSLFLWGVDSFLLWGMSKVAGSGVVG